MSRPIGPSRHTVKARLEKTSRGRLRIGLGFMLALLLIITGKLVFIQGLDSGRLADAAVSQREVVQTLPATRGRILDANGKVIAASVLHYNITISQKSNTSVDEFTRRSASKPKELETISREQGLTELAGALGMDADKVRTIATGTANFGYVAKDVTPQVEAKVMALRLPGVYSEAVSRRVYPMGSVGGNIVGFLSADGEPLAGIEQTMDAKLSGKNGSRTFQRGANGILIPTAPVTTEPAVNGQDVKLTINQDIQYYAQQAAEQQKTEYNAEWTNIVVGEVKTGNIIAMADSSSVDPNDPGATAAKDRGARTITAAIEPGSTEKTVTAAAAIQEGKVSPLSHLVIPPTYTTNGQTFSDAFPHGTENRTFAGVIGDSLNTGTVMVGEKLTIQQRHNYLSLFGIGQKTGIPLPGESPGILAKPENWDSRQQYTVLFGQGVAQTPLQTSMIYQTIANNGVRLKPRLIDSVTSPDGTVHKTPIEKGTKVVSPETAKDVRDILESVTTVADATNVKIPGYRVGGKTGTAEAPSENGQGFDGYTSSFVGMAPMEDPKYVVLVTVQRPQGRIYGVNQGSTFNNVMGQVLRTYGVKASTTPSVKLPQYFGQQD